MSYVSSIEPKSTVQKPATPSKPQHYKAYKPRPFTKDERDDTTILFAGLTWKHDRLIQGNFHNLGYKAEPLPNVERKDLDTGKELIDAGACCPTTFVTGNLANYLKEKSVETSKQDVADKFVYLTVGACGSCRLGQYHQSYAMALDILGMKDFRFFLLDQNVQQEAKEGETEDPGLNINAPLTTGILLAMFCADLLADLEFMTRPYEVNPGDTDKALKESIEYLYQVFKERPYKGKVYGVMAWHYFTRYFTKALREVLKKWDAVEVDRLRVKPKVKITGEFWVQTHEGDGNYNIKRWLEQENAEVIVPPIAVWFDYLMQFAANGYEDQIGVKKGSRLKLFGIHLLKRIYRRAYDRLRRTLNNLPQEMPDQKEMCDLAKPYFHRRLDGGEGYMLIGKALHAYHHNKAHMICELSPYSCLPNTMSIGAMANVLGKYPDLLYAAIEIKGDAEVHALSRCQMILSEAKKRAQKEYEEVLKKTGLTEDRIRAYEDKHPEVRKATYRVPHVGGAGSAANYVLYLAKKI